ncbi:MAG TPA: hypothetical protein PKU97_19535 [Kofleriaceae bacterium]|nr:hypothetical protein [Kofleriaceae bacterium]
MTDVRQAPGDDHGDGGGGGGDAPNHQAAQPPDTRDAQDAQDAQDAALWSRLRAGLEDRDLDDVAWSTLRSHAHARLRRRPARLRAAFESLAIAAVVAAQLSWAFSVVLG